jgi:hypothetical protein
VIGSVYRGHEGIDGWFDDLAEAWESIEAHLEEIAEEDKDTTLVLVRLEAKGRESGVDLNEPVAQRHSWRGEKLVRIAYVDRQEAEAIMERLR